MKTINLSNEQTVLLMAAVQRYQRGLSSQPLGTAIDGQCVDLIKLLSGEGQVMNSTSTSKARSTDGQETISELVEAVRCLTFAIETVVNLNSGRLNGQTIIGLTEYVNYGHLITNKYGQPTTANTEVVS